jgi:2-succinyl-5-enolpyruvyl-6-hydroxy-3-cyclohexene-1-carboxylate synthase
MSDHLSWTSHLFRAFYQEGVRHVYISPGSRSTPLVLAAASHPGFSKHIVIDERSAAFQALGCSKASGMPSILICTSGTALANYHPAVIESKQSGIPLIIISADRPPHLRGTGSSQTIDQIKIFSDAVLYYHELGEPVHEKRDYNRLTLLAKQAVDIALNRAGPVHINAPFRKPLEPSKESLLQAENLNRDQVSLSLKKRSITDSSGGTYKLPEEMISLLNDAHRPIIIAGPVDQPGPHSDLVSRLSRNLNIPVIAEPGSQLPGSLKFISKFDLLLNSKYNEKSLLPDLIIKTGQQPFSRSLQVFETENRSIPVLQFLNRDTWQDSFGTVSHRSILNNRIPELESLSPKNQAWQDLWIKKNREAGSALKNALQSEHNLADGHVIDHFTKSLSTGWDIMTSNSFTIRDLSLFGHGTLHISNSYVNRGAAGIDGILSTAVGIQHFNQRRMFVFIGDLALLHDSNALLNMKESNQPLAITVLNNGGGNIFRMLPVYSEKKYFEKYFQTPQHADFSSLARMHGLSYHFIDSLKKLKKTNPDDIVSDGPVLIECKTDPDKSMKMRNILWNQ